MAVDDFQIRVENYTEVLRAFGKAGHALERGMPGALKEAIEPIREDAERRAGSEIRNLDDGDPWARVRSGATKRMVYIAPVERGRRTRGNSAIGRPNLKPLLLDRAYEPALEDNRDVVIEQIEDLLGYVARTFDNA